MNKLPGSRLAVISAVAFAAVGCQATGSASSGAGTVAATPSSDPSTAEPSSAAWGGLPEGAFALWEGSDVEPPITLTIAAPNWEGNPGDGYIIKNGDAGAPDGAGMIVFEGLDMYVYSDPCRWSTTMPEAPATTVDDLVAALASQASRDASEPEDVRVSGFAGKSITLHVPDDAVFSDCDRREFRTLVDDPEVDGARYAQDPGQIDKLWVLDVDGQPAIVDIAYYDGTPQAVIDEMEAMVESIDFD